MAARVVRLGDVLTAVENPVKIQDNVIYTRVTVRNRSRGLCVRDRVQGSDIGTKRQYRISSGEWLVANYDISHGAHGLVPEELDGAVVTQHFPTFTIDTEECLPAFLELWASRPDFWDECDAISEGSTKRSRIDHEQFLDLELPLPSLEDQARMVRLAQGLQDEAEAAGNLANKFGVLRSCLRDELLEDAPETPISEIVLRLEGGRSPRCHDRPPSGDEWGVLKTSSVRPGIFRPEEAKALPSDVRPHASAEVAEGDILTVRASGTRDLVGCVCRVGHVPPRLLLSDYHWRLSLDLARVDPDYFVEAMASSKVRRQIADATLGSTTAGKLSRGRLANVTVPLLPGASQTQIARHLGALHRAERAARAFREASEALRLRLALELP